VVAGTVLAAVRIDRLERSPVGRYAARHLIRGRVHGDARVEAARGAGDAALDVGGRVLRRQLARREPRPGRRRPVEPVDAECPPVVAAAIPCHEIPATPQVDERVRLDLAARVAAVATAIVEAKALGVAACPGDHGQMLGVDGRAGDRRRDRRRRQSADAAAQVRGQDLLELDEGADGALLDAGHGGASGRAKPDRDRDRLVLVEQQRWHRGAGAKPVATGRPAQRLDRVAEGAQALDVAPDRAPGHLEPLRQLRARPVAACLQQRQQLEESARGLAHANSMVVDIEDRS
jgi:hypothetical protein